MKTAIKASPRPKLAQKDWVAAARKLLIKGGISNVGVRGLSSELGVSTGAFYWQYANLEQLLCDLRTDWETNNTASFTKAVQSAGPDGWDQYLAIGRVMMYEEDYDPAYDNAIRDWAHGDKATAKVLRKVDTYRIKLAANAFEAMGYVGNAAQIRARVHYYHQVGYQAMRIKETLEQRLENAPFYTEIISGDSRLSLLEGPDAVNKMYASSRNNGEQSREQ